MEKAGSPPCYSNNEFNVHSHASPGHPLQIVSRHWAEVPPARRETDHPPTTATSQRNITCNGAYQIPPCENGFLVLLACSAPPLSRIEQCKNVALLAAQQVNNHPESYQSHGFGSKLLEGGLKIAEDIRKAWVVMILRGGNGFRSLRGEPASWDLLYVGIAVCDSPNSASSSLISMESLQLAPNHAIFSAAALSRSSLVRN